jgi:hypothetical protein
VARRDVPEPWASAMAERGLIDPHRTEAVPSIRALAEQADVAPETVRRMVWGERVPDPATVQAVAEALGVDSRKVADWVGQVRSVRRPYQAPSEANLLNDDEQDAITQLIRVMTAGRKRVEQQGAQGATITPMRREAPPTTTADPDYAQAAYRPAEPPAAELDSHPDDGGA